MQNRTVSENRKSSRVHATVVGARSVILVLQWTCSIYTENVAIAGCL